MSVIDAILERPGAGPAGTMAEAIGACKASYAAWEPANESVDEQLYGTADYCHDAWIALEGAGIDVLDATLDVCVTVPRSSAEAHAKYEYLIALLDDGWRLPNGCVAAILRAAILRECSIAGRAAS